MDDEKKKKEKYNERDIYSMQNTKTNLNDRRRKRSVIFYE
jgi:hypothetical protein